MQGDGQRYGQMNPCIASRFLSEILEEIIDKIDKTNRNYSVDTFNVNNRKKKTTNETLFKFDLVISVL